MTDEAGPVPAGDPADLPMAEVSPRRRAHWVVRAGEENRLVDEFIDSGVTGVGYFTVPDGNDLTYDHNHATGQFRGFLCRICNRVLGQMGDDPVKLRNLADYAERTRQ